MHHSILYLYQCLLIIYLYSLFSILCYSTVFFPLCLGHALYRYHYCIALLQPLCSSLVLFILLVQGGLAFVRTSVSFCWNFFLSCESMGTSPMTCSMKIQRFLKSFLPMIHLKSFPCSARKLVSSSHRVPGNTLCLPPSYALTCRIKGKLWEVHRAMEQSSLQVTVTQASRKKKHSIPFSSCLLKPFYTNLLKWSWNEVARSECGFLFDYIPVIFSTLLPSHRSCNTRLTLPECAVSSLEKVM